MKPLLAVVAGFAVALATFAGGAFMTFMVLGPEPERILVSSEDTTVWTSQPIQVDVAAQPFERVESRAVAVDAQPVLVDAKDEVALAVDTTTTSAVPTDDATSESQAAEAALVFAHMDWCQDRYRSYDVDSNTYRPFRGGRKDCVSPYLEELAALQAGAQTAGRDAQPAMESSYIDASAGHAELAAGSGFPAGSQNAYGQELSMAHVQDCFDRYRSYDPLDNSYQPYGGGPREQCQ